VPRGSQRPFIRASLRSRSLRTRIVFRGMGNGDGVPGDPTPRMETANQLRGVRGARKHEVVPLVGTVYECVR
jgi:hypothetical protein